MQQKQQSGTTMHNRRQPAKTHLFSSLQCYNVFIRCYMDRLSHKPETYRFFGSMQVSQTEIRRPSLLYVTIISGILQTAQHIVLNTGTSTSTLLLVFAALQCRPFLGSSTRCERRDLVACMHVCAHVYGCVVGPFRRVSNGRRSPS